MPQWRRQQQRQNHENTEKSEKLYKKVYNKAANSGKKATDADAAPGDEKAKESSSTGIGPFIIDVISGFVCAVAIALLAPYVSDLVSAK